MYLLSVKSVIKSSVLENFTGSISSLDMIFSLGVAFIIGMFIIFIYRKTYTGVVYSKSFTLCILLLSLITSMIIRTISSNISLSLGMVGALSIVRFRTAVKDPVDTAFMFWGICAGIMSGAGLYIPSLVGSLMLGALYFGAYLLGFKVQCRYLLVIKYNSSAHDKVLSCLKSINKFKIRSKSISANNVELSIELDLKENKGKVNTKVVDQFQNIDGVINASLVSYQNDFGD